MKLATERSSDHVKKLISIQEQAEPHWVGDGFRVRSILSYHEHGAAISPFLLLDYAAPAEFPPTDKPRGVERHPHRGFETVTIVYQGAVAHRDSAGHSGTIGPGDVQWMTAASGIIHEEFHEPAFSRRGGVLQMVQLWVNLPAKDKTSPPGYQSLLAADIPTVPLPGGGGTARIIAGGLGETRGPARTFTPMNVWDLHLKKGAATVLPASDGHMAGLLVLAGRLRFDGSRTADDAAFALLDRASAGVTVSADEDSGALFLSGQPIDEPIATRGPFVMNTPEEIQQAIRDYQSGRMGSLA